MDLLGTALIVQLNVSSDVVGLLSLCVSVAQLAATIWLARHPGRSEPTPPRDVDHDVSGEQGRAASIEELIAELEAERRQRIDEAERIGAAIQALRGQS